MSRSEIKRKAREQLGGNIFATPWLIAILVALIGNAIVGVSSFISFIFIGPITFGLSSLFLKQARDRKTMDVAGLFDGFNYFGQTFLLGFLSTLFIALWSMLFVIPGIVKTYSYSMIYYIKADHPEYDWKQCIDESRRIMNGHKMELFIQDLSFIGWNFLAMLPVIGWAVQIWTMPYISLTYALYFENRSGRDIYAAQSGGAVPPPWEFQ